MMKIYTYDGLSAITDDCLYWGVYKLGFGHGIIDTAILEQGGKRARKHLLKTDLRPLSKIIGRYITFDLYTTRGIPIEVVQAGVDVHGWNVDEEGFNELLKQHKQLSKKEDK